MSCVQCIYRDGAKTNIPFINNYIIVHMHALYYDFTYIVYTYNYMYIPLSLSLYPLCWLHISEQLYMQKGESELIAYKHVSLYSNVIELKCVMYEPVYLSMSYPCHACAGGLYTVVVLYL